MFLRLRGMGRTRVHVSLHKMLTEPTMYVTPTLLPLEGTHDAASYLADFSEVTVTATSIHLQFALLFLLLLHSSLHSIEKNHYFENKFTRSLIIYVPPFTAT
jgi:hypothetical protein